jgi:Putative adhesin
MEKSVKLRNCRTRVLGMAVVVVLACAPTALAQTIEGSFQRTLTVSGQPDVEIESGSGRIEVRPGASGRVEISGRIRASDDWGWRRRSLNAEQRVRRLESTPPVEQTGSAVRIGRIADEEVRDGVSVSYVVTMPADALLRAKTGSGSQQIEGIRGRVTASTGSGSIVLRDVGGAVSTSTGSGSITVDRVDGSFNGSTGSGSIRAGAVTGAITARTSSGGIDVSQTGSGDVDVSSSSGTVHVRGVRGRLEASTTSGGLHVQGEPSGGWRLSASSGSVEIDLPDNAGFELDAGTGSGGIDVDMPVTVAGSLSRRTLRGTVRGGGPQLHVRTSSGGIHIK